MRTPSRASIALAMGGVAATIGFTGVAATSASAAAHPSLARPSVAHRGAHVLRGRVLDDVVSGLHGLLVWPKDRVGGRGQAGRTQQPGCHRECRDAARQTWLDQCAGDAARRFAI